MEDNRNDKLKYKQTFIFFRVTMSALQIKLLSIEPLLKIKVKAKLLFWVHHFLLEYE